MIDIAQRLRDRCDINKWHDAGLLNTYRIDDVLHWPRLTNLILEAADRIEQLERDLSVERLKNRNSLANNLCPDHRDKQSGKPCLACRIETLTRGNAELYELAARLRLENAELRTRLEGT